MKIVRMEVLFQNKENEISLHVFSGNRNELDWCLKEK